jgi:hypothetical protein
MGPIAESLPIAQTYTNFIEKLAASLKGIVRQNILHL